MHHWTYLIRAITAVSFFHSAMACDVLLSNDDGWAGAFIRAQRDSLVNAGFNVVLSGLAQDMSDRGASSAPLQPLAEPCQFNTCPTGSPAEGFNASDPRLNYVNAFAVDAVRYGIQTLSPKIFCSPPEFVISGPNSGPLLGVGTPTSSAIAVACEAAKEGFPAVAFAAGTATKISYTTLTTLPNSRNTLSALLYAELSSNFTHALVDPVPRPILPGGVFLRVNYAPTTFSASGRPTGKCIAASDYKWVLTRQQPGNAVSTVGTCGSKRLPVDRGATRLSQCSTRRQGWT
ncbi:hypothetical protein GSI_11803 [Ganoderma sinense ZZ0214-1]|uniref:Survival protein SurE-like phosphatase/nucleotidase domain-containing protein n=1 Tax=Ganoderma sinense ZZ0214-1 TaxID=1077348 RepID=A0A2G8RX03_9APHY|nr:hypothetical protein GSI_11803 [Ganoderma sinense ZZ0214-1]